MKFLRKGIIKKIGLVLLGLGVLGGAAVGVTHLVNHMKQDKESIHPTFEVGGLNAQGKYEEDKASLYTKDKFACEGLKATLDFDAQINYQIFYYDILDNFISSTEVLTDGYGEKAPTNGAYARIELTPTNDKDNKISLKERVTYANQLNLKVAKNAESNVYKKFTSYKGTNLDITSNLNELIFVQNQEFNLEEGFKLTTSTQSVCTTKNLLDVTEFNTIKLVTGSSLISCSIFEFDSYNLDSAKVTVSSIGLEGSGNVSTEVKFKSDTKVILISGWSSENANIDTIYQSFELK